MELRGVHRAFPVTVTQALGPWQSAFVGQPLFRMNGNLYGGTLCTFISDGGDPEESNALAQKCADEHNANATRKFDPIPQPVK